MTPNLRLAASSALWLFALLAGRESAAQPSDTPAAPPEPAIELDRDALVIDVAAERRALDASIRRELARRSAAERQRDAKLATSGTRPRG